MFIYKIMAKKDNPKSSVPNKRSTPAIYRKIEVLTINLMKQTGNIPNTPMIRESLSRLSNEFLECCAAVRYAYCVSAYDVRYGYLLELEVHLEMIETIIKILFEYATFSGAKFMTIDHHAKYLMEIDSIRDQCLRWKAATEKTLATINTVSTQGVSGSPEVGLIQAKGSGGSEDFSIPENTQFMALGPDRVITNTPFGNSR